MLGVVLQPLHQVVRSTGGLCRLNGRSAFHTTMGQAWWMGTPWNFSPMRSNRHPGTARTVGNHRGLASFLLRTFPPSDERVFRRGPATRPQERGTIVGMAREAGLFALAKKTGGGLRPWVRAPPGRIFPTSARWHGSGACPTRGTVLGPRLFVGGGEHAHFPPRAFPGKWTPFHPPWQPLLGGKELKLLPAKTGGRGRRWLVRCLAETRGKKARFLGTFGGEPFFVGRNLPGRWSDVGNPGQFPPPGSGRGVARSKNSI